MSVVPCTKRSSDIPTTACGHLVSNRRLTSPESLLQDILQTAVDVCERLGCIYRVRLVTPTSHLSVASHKRPRLSPAGAVTQGQAQSFGSFDLQRHRYPALPAYGEAILRQIVWSIQRSSKPCGSSALHLCGVFARKTALVLPMDCVICHCVESLKLTLPELVDAPSRIRIESVASTSSLVPMSRQLPIRLTGDPTTKSNLCIASDIL